MGPDHSSTLAFTHFLQQQPNSIRKLILGFNTREDKKALNGTAVAAEQEEAEGEELYSRPRKTSAQLLCWHCVLSEGRRRKTLFHCFIRHSAIHFFIKVPRSTPTNSLIPLI